MTTRTTTMRRYICVLFLFFLIDRPLVGEMTHCALHHWNTRDAHEKPRRKNTVRVVAPLHLLFLSSSPAVPLIHFLPPLHIPPLPLPSPLSILLQLCSHLNMYVSAAVEMLHHVGRLAILYICKWLSLKVAYFKTCL